VYDLGNRIVRFNNQGERSSVIDLLRPYYIENFENIVRSKATPIDFETVFHDKYYSNISNYRLRGLHQLIGNNQYILGFMTDLKESIDQYLEE